MFSEHNARVTEERDLGPEEPPGGVEPGETRRETCGETTTIRWPGDAFDPRQEPKIVALECCLIAPHREYKHLNPRLQMTLGGTHLIVPGWSPWLDAVDVERCGPCGGITNGAEGIMPRGHVRSCDRISGKCPACQELGCAEGFCLRGPVAQPIHDAEAFQLSSRDWTVKCPCGEDFAATPHEAIARRWAVEHNRVEVAKA